MSEPPVNWSFPVFLRDGTPRQQSAWRALEDLAIFEKLAPFDPLLAGTIPLGIDHPGSDLDIVCAVVDPEFFIEVVTRHFQYYDHFAVHRKSIGQRAVIIVRFIYGGFPFELFGQDVPSREQPAYRHMLIEHRLLMLGGPAFRRVVTERKQRGEKTEPVFAELLGLMGDPYLALLELEGCEDEMLEELLRRR